MPCTRAIVSFARTRSSDCDMPDRKDVNVLRQHNAPRPIVRHIDRPARPINLNLAFAQPRKLLEQQHDRRRPGAIDVQHVARQAAPRRRLPPAPSQTPARPRDTALRSSARADGLESPPVRGAGAPGANRWHAPGASRLGHRRLHAQIETGNSQTAGQSIPPPRFLQLQLARRRCSC